MILKPYSYNGTSLQSATFVANFPRESADLQITTNPAYVRRAGASPVYAGKDFQAKSIKLEINCGSNFMTNFEALNTLFDTKDETPRQFICTDEEDSSKQYYVYATASKVLGGHDGSMAVVTLALDDPIWQTVTQNSQTFTITASTDSTSVTNNGNDYAFPIFEITPTSQPSTDYLYNTYCQVLPQSTDPYPSRYLDITGATDTTWDTAALVAAGKMQSAGQDIRVLRDGVFVDFWLDGINTTDTHVIVIEDVPAKTEMTLKTAIASTDTVTEIELSNTADNRTKISLLPPTGRLILDSSLGSTDTEEFTYTSKTITNTKLAYTINARSVRNTTASSFSAGANVRYLPWDYNIIYGNSTVSAYVTDDTRKPIHNLTSRNNSLSYSYFYDLAGLRTGIFTQDTRMVSNPLLSRSVFYTSTNDEGDTDPSRAMGNSVSTYVSNGSYRSDTVTFRWQCYFPDLVSTISADGEQYQTHAMPSLATGFYASKSSTGAGTRLFAVDNLTASTDFSVWKTWSKASTDSTVPAGTKYLRFQTTGSIASGADRTAKYATTSLTVTLTNYPHVMVRSESQNYKADFIIYNNTSGEWMRVTYPMSLNETLYIDTDPSYPYAKYKGLTVNGAIGLSSIRAAWLKMNPGANTIGYETQLSASSNLSIVIKWRDRMNFF